MEKSKEVSSNEFKTMEKLYHACYDYLMILFDKLEEHNFKCLDKITMFREDVLLKLIMYLISVYLLDSSKYNQEELEKIAQVQENLMRVYHLGFIAKKYSLSHEEALNMNEHTNEYFKQIDFFNYCFEKNNFKKYVYYSVPSLFFGLQIITNKYIKTEEISKTQVTKEQKEENDKFLVAVLESGDIADKEISIKIDNIIKDYLLNERKEALKIIYIHEEELKEEIRRLQTKDVNAVFPGGEKQIENVGKEILFYLNGKLKIKEMYGFYMRDCFFLLIDGDVYGLYMHMQRKYNKILTKEEQIKLMAILLTNRSNPNYQFDENDSLEFFTNHIKQTIKNTDENDNEGVMRGAYGKFGIEKTNPIPVFGHNGLDEYFKKLKLENGHYYKYERLGSTSSKNINGIIDIYEITDAETNDKICKLFICIYNKHTSNISPEGFKIIENID